MVKPLQECENRRHVQSKEQPRIQYRRIRDVPDIPALQRVQWRALALLAQHEPMSASELVERSPMDKASVSRAVARLIELGYIHIDPHPVDGRMQTIRLSRSGWALYRKVAPLSAQRQTALLSVLTPTEKKSFFSMLDRIENQATRHFSEDAVTTGNVTLAKARPKKQNKSQIR
jgi:DNA-binding MarR family transcriptional regulator